MSAILFKMKSRIKHSLLGVSSFMLESQWGNSFDRTQCFVAHSLSLNTFSKPHLPLSRGVGYFLLAWLVCAVKS